MVKSKKTTSYRLTPRALELCADLADELGISKTATIELALRHMADAELPKTLKQPISDADKAQLAELRKRERAEVKAKKKAGLYIGNTAVT